MNLSQFCNIISPRKPAAKYANTGRLSYAISSHPGGRFAPVMSAGFTLVEVLVAMVILLVGIWTLAMGFPRLLGVVASQEKRTEMARQLDSALEQMQRNPQNLPLAIRPDSWLPAAEDPTATPPEGVDANSEPQDPDFADYVMTPPNSRDDIIEVIGEGFTVPARTPPPFGGLPAHVFRQGLAEPGATVVYQVFDATTGNPKPWQAKISIDSVGVLSILPPADPAYIANPSALDPVTPWTAYVSYAWVPTGYDPNNPDLDEVYYVNGEETPGGPVLASAHPDFGQIVEGSLSGEVRAYYDLAAADIIQHESGAALTFPPNFAGARMRVNYTLRAARNGRRSLIMSEQHRIVSSPQTITLVSSHIDDETALPVDLNGDGLDNDTNILAVDLNTGYVYWETSGLDWIGDDATSAGRITVGETTPAPPVGDDLRFYYATFDQDVMTVQRAPASFLDWNVVDGAAQNGPPPQADYAAKQYYRTYETAHHPSDPYTDLLFYPCYAGHSVAVDYTYIDSTGSTPVKRKVRGEMHTINTEPDGTGDHHITLQHADVEEILAVRGVSLKGRGWWRAANGRLVHLDVDTILGLEALF